jgi:hypothetical protein
MPETSIRPPRRNLARLLLLPLIIVPFLPELAIVATAALARLGGCEPAESSTCLIATLPVSEVIALALRVKASFIVDHIFDPKYQAAWLSALYLAIAVWLVVCYLAVIRGWTHLASRLVIGFLVTLIFALLPYVGSMLALADLTDEGYCLPNEGGIGTCRLFGGYIQGPEYSPAHDAVRIGWLGFLGAPLALALFAVYAIVVIVMAVRQPKPLAASA